VVYAVVGRVGVREATVHFRTNLERRRIRHVADPIEDVSWKFSNPFAAGPSIFFT
jgi:hypothetical protein